MTIKEQLFKEIEATPDSILQEVLSFLLFLKTEQSQHEAPNFTSTALHSTARYILDNLDNIGTWEGDDFEHEQEQLEIRILSEPILAKEWLTPEEDEAWRHL